MLINVDESPVGTGKTERAIAQMLSNPGRWLVAVERQKSISELVGRIEKKSKARSAVKIQTVMSSGDISDGLRGGSVRTSIEALPKLYEAGHVIVVCTHAGLMMSDLSGFQNWNLIVDETPQVLMINEVQSKLDVEYFRKHYSLEEITSDWSKISPTDEGRRISGSDIQDDESHRHLKLFHQRVIDSEKNDRPVICDLKSWTDMSRGGVKWTWWNLFSVTELAAFSSVQFLANRFMQSIGAKMMMKWAPEVVWNPTSSNGTRKLRNRRVTIEYYSDRPSSLNLFNGEKGKAALDKIGYHLAENLDADTFIWSSNESFKDVLLNHLPASRRLSPKQAGTNAWMASTHAAMIYAAKPSTGVRSALKAIGVKAVDWVATEEWETILQFVTRTSIRDIESDSDVKIYVFDKDQAEFLIQFFREQRHIETDIIFVDLDLDLSKDKSGPKPRYLSPQEAEEKKKKRREEKAIAEQARRERIKSRSL